MLEAILAELSLHELSDSTGQAMSTALNKPAKGNSGFKFGSLANA
jgi:hypothetical protein